jgi:SAM-dependent methyltransferase
MGRRLRKGASLNTSVSKMAGTNQLVDYHDDAYHENRHPEMFDNVDLATAWSCFADQAYFNDIVAGQTVIEIGGGMGHNLIEVKRRAEVLMVEPSSLGRQQAEKYGISSVGDLSEIEVSRRFDVILLRHVLEHVDHPLELLVKLRDRLTDGGKLIIAVPVESPIMKVSADDLNFHLYGWNPQTLYNLVRRSGFENVSTRFEYYAGRRRLLTVYRRLGGKAYAKAVRLLGRLTGAKELVAIGTLQA